MVRIPLAPPPVMYQAVSEDDQSEPNLTTQPNQTDSYSAAPSDDEKLDPSFEMELDDSDDQ